MKNFQQNLLIVLALALCGLSAFQWHGQTVQRTEIQALNGLVSDKNVAIRDATNSVADLNRQLGQMDARLTDLKTEAATNAELVVAQKAGLAALQFSNASLTNQIIQYKTAVDTLELRLKDAYTGLEGQNDMLTNLVAQRDELVKKYNDEVKERNDIVARYNDLAAQVQKNQPGGK